jgi:hypothetical protein
MDELWLVLIWSGLAGIVRFLGALRSGALRQHYWRRLATDVIGAAIVGSFCGCALAPKSADPLIKIAVAFAGGLCWLEVVDVLKSRFLHMLLGEHSNSDD